MNPITEAPIGETLPNTPDDLYVYLWRLHSAIRKTYLMSAVITAMALKQDAEIVHNLGLLVNMDEYQRSLVGSEELIQKLNKTVQKNLKNKPGVINPLTEISEEKKKGLINRLLSSLVGVRSHDK